MIDNTQLALFLTISTRYSWIPNIKYHDGIAFQRLIEVYPLLQEIEQCVEPGSRRRIADAFLVAKLLGYVAYRRPRPVIADSTGELALETWRAELAADGLTDAGWEAMMSSAPPLVQGWAKRLTLVDDRADAIEEANALADKRAARDDVKCLTS